tara:strand:- start:1513 stop:1737 length:225 start_codon:yes stop_codon:yes gene_type:complete
MFKPEDYELPLEKVLSLRVINDDIESCRDVKVLQNSLKDTSRLLLTYQHLLGAVLKEQILSNLPNMLEEETAGE